MLISYHICVCIPQVVNLRPKRPASMSCLAVNHSSPFPGAVLLADLFGRSPNARSGGLMPRMRQPRTETHHTTPAMSVPMGEKDDLEALKQQETAQEEKQMVSFTTDFENLLQDLCRKLLRLLSNEAARTRIARYHAETSVQKPSESRASKKDQCDQGSVTSFPGCLCCAALKAQLLGCTVTASPSRQGSADLLPAQARPVLAVLVLLPHAT